MLGQNLPAYRAVSLVFAILAVLLMFCVARQVTTTTTAAWAALLLASYQSHIAAAVFARFYSAFVAASLCAIWLFQPSQTTRRSDRAFLAALGVCRLVHEFAVILALLPLCEAVCAPRGSVAASLLLAVPEVRRASGSHPDRLDRVRGSVDCHPPWSDQSEARVLRQRAARTASAARPSVGRPGRPPPDRGMAPAGWHRDAPDRARAVAGDRGIRGVRVPVPNGRPAHGQCGGDALAAPPGGANPSRRGDACRRRRRGVDSLHGDGHRCAVFSRLAYQLVSATMWYPWEGLVRLGETLTLTTVAAGLVTTALVFRRAESPKDDRLRVVALFSVITLAVLGLSASSCSGGTFSSPRRPCSSYRRSSSSPPGSGSRT